MTTITEHDVEHTVLDRLADFGWQIAYGPDIAPDAPNAERTDYGQVMLEQWVRASLGPDGAAVRCGAPARGGSPGAGAYRSNQDHHRPEDSCAPAKRCRRESRVALRAPMAVQDVVKPLARPQNDGSAFETVSSPLNGT